MRVVGAEAQQRSTRTIPCKTRRIIIMIECIPLANQMRKYLFVKKESQLITSDVKVR